MPVGVFSSGGLNIQPNIIRAPVDPLERAIKEAQLYNLQQDPRFRERQLTLEALGLQNTQANHEAMRKIQEGQLAETTRHNVVDETHNTGALVEAGRHNLATEGSVARTQDIDIAQLLEAGRHNVATEGATIRGQDITAADSTGQQKTAVTTALIHTLLGNYGTDEQKSVAAETLALMGYPQFKTALGTRAPTADEKLGALSVEMIKKNKEGGTVAPFGSTPVQSREYQRPKFDLMKFFRTGQYQ